MLSTCCPATALWIPARPATCHSLRHSSDACESLAARARWRVTPSTTPHTLTQARWHWPTHCCAHAVPRFPTYLCPVWCVAPRSYAFASEAALVPMSQFRAMDVILLLIAGLARETGSAPPAPTSHADAGNTSACNLHAHVRPRSRTYMPAGARGAPALCHAANTRAHARGPLRLGSGVVQSI